MNACVFVLSNVHSNVLNLSLCIKFIKNTAHHTDVYLLVEIYNNIYSCKPYLKFVGFFFYYSEQE